jgi:TP901 family phage tail tape measure protein
MPDGTTVNLKLLIQAVDKASKTVASLEGKLNQVSKAAVELGTKTEKSSSKGKAGLDKMTGSATKTAFAMDKIAASVTKIGVKMVGLGAAMSAPFALALKSSAEFEKSFAKVVAVTTGGRENFQQLKDTAAELGRTTKFTATEAAQGMAFLGQAGFDAKEVISGIGPSITLARVAAVDLGTAADLASNVIAGMRLEVNDLGIAVDVLAQTAAKSNTNLLEMAEAISYSGPVAAAVGVDIQQLSSLVGILGNAGIKGSRAGTALRQAMFRLANPSEAITQTFDDMGVQISTTADGSIDLIGVLKQLAEANITAGEANKIFGRFASAGVLAITSQVEELDVLIEQNYAAAGASELMAKTMSDTLKGAVVRLTSALDGLRRTVGDKLIPVFTAVTRIITTVVGSITALAEAFPVVTSVVTQVVAVLGFLLTTIGAVAIAVGGFIKALSVLTAISTSKWVLAFTANLKVLFATMFAGTAQTNLFTASLVRLRSAVLLNSLGTTVFVGILKTLAFGLKAAAASAIRLMATLLANPFIAAAAGITAVVVALFEWDRRLDTAIKSNKKLSSELNGVVASYEKQIESLNKLEKGTLAYTKGSLNLRRQLLKTAQENGALSEQALAAADSINAQTGAIDESSTALEKFVQATRDLELKTLTDQVELLGERLQRLKGDGNFASQALEGTKIAARKLSAAFKDLFSGNIGSESGAMAKVFEEQAKALEEVEAQTKAAANAAILQFQAYDEIDMSASTAEMEVFFTQVKGLTGETASIFLERFEEMQKAAQRTTKAAKELEIASTGELTISVSRTVEEVKNLRVAYEEAAKASALISESGGEGAEEAVKARIEANKKRLAAERELNDKIQALLKVSSNELKDTYDDELRDLKRKKDLEYIQEWQFNLDKAKLDEDFSNEKRKNLLGIIEQAKSSGATELEIWKTLNGELRKIDGEVKRRSESNRDAQILHANQVADAILEIKQKTQDIDLELAPTTQATFDVQAQREVDDLKRNAAKQGLNDAEVIAKAEAAIRRKYAREASNYEEDLKQKSADLDISRAQRTADRQVEVLERAFSEGKISPQDYVNAATVAQTGAIDREIEEIQRRLEYAQQVLHDNPLTIQIQAELDELTDEKRFIKEDQSRALREAVGQRKLEDLRTEESATQSAIVSTPDNLANMEAQNELALELMRNRQAQELVEMEMHGAAQAEIVDRHNQQILALNAIAAEQNEKVWEAKMGWGAEMAGTLSDAFGKMYELTGKKSKEFFYAQKAAAIAEATMNIAVGISRAYKQQGAYGSIGAAIVAAAGAVQIATIAAQGLAEGGQVQGSSPTNTADNIPAWLTAKEFVHPVSAVDYYGVGVMEAMRKRMIPKEVFQGYRIPVPVRQSRRGYAEGGSVRSSSATGGAGMPGSGEEKQQEVNITNIIDPAMMGQYVSSRPGQDNIMNVMSQNQFKLKQLVFS